VVRRRKAQAVAVAAALVLGGCSLGDEGGEAPQVSVDSGEDQAVAKLGFPASATRNTIRVGGADATADAAGVASALFPATVQANRPTAVVLVDQNKPADAVSAAVLAGPPIGAPLLVSDGGDMPAATRETLDKLKPKGSDLSKDAQVIRIGDEVARPGGFKSAVIEGDDAYERAAAIDRFFSAARGKPSKSVVLVSGERPAWAMPAASWASRSGDAALPVAKGSIPDPIRKALAEHDKPDVFVLGPKSVISDGVLDQARPLAKSVQRITAKSPVASAIAFSRYERGGFGWGVVVPGYNFAVANTGRPLDAAAAASLASRGVFAPLLLTDRSEELPKALETYLLSVQPGYEDSPSDAVYNRVWLLGDGEAVSVGQQARIDHITELIPVQANAP